MPNKQEIDDMVASYTDTAEAELMEDLLNMDEDDEEVDNISGTTTTGSED